MWEPRLPLYRVRGQGVYKEGGSPDRRVVSLREVLTNLACKLRCLVEYVWTWLSSWSCGLVVAWCDVVLLFETLVLNILFFLYGATVASKCFKSRPGVAHGLRVGNGQRHGRRSGWRGRRPRQRGPTAAMLPREPDALCAHLLALRGSARTLVSLFFIIQRHTKPGLKREIESGVLETPKNHIVFNKIVVLETMMHVMSKHLYIYHLQKNKVFTKPYYYLVLIFQNTLYPKCGALR